MGIERIIVIIFLGNSGNIDDAPTFIAIVYAIFLITCMALMWTFIWFVLMLFGVTHFDVLDWLLKGFMFYFFIFGIPILYALYEDRKK